MEDTDFSMDTKFSTEFLTQKFSATFKGVYHEWTTSPFLYERYVQVKLPEHSHLTSFFGATHVGFRGCYVWHKELGFNAGTDRRTEPACLVLLANGRALSGTQVRLKDIFQFQRVFQGILRESGASNADHYVEIIRELKAIVKTILEKNPEAFKQST
jgi:hypothetical protein